MPLASYTLGPSAYFTNVASGTHKGVRALWLADNPHAATLTANCIQKPFAENTLELQPRA